MSSPRFSYPSLGAFYAADQRRARSRETDLGLWWRSDRSPGPTFRAAHVDATGEVYLMQHEGLPGGGRIEVVLHDVELDEVTDRTTGYEQVIDEPGSIKWLRARLAAPALTAMSDVALALAV